VTVPAVIVGRALLRVGGCVVALQVMMIDVVSGYLTRLLTTIDAAAGAVASGRLSDVLLAASLVAG
jgi:hypothetical protein